uniref:Ethylmalonyl-CoA decarboxylase n=1 Tax=Dermatophagoides pteronyssinus TaxID=6956 RepID=A0A6P6YKN7_DERPT|nr:ethylmalonyl-CoA decarboxylase-like [Dermatophagoides pteronyssinus]
MSSSSSSSSNYKANVNNNIINNGTHILKNGHHNSNIKMSDDSSTLENDMISRLPDLSIEHIREQLRQCDPNSNGRLELSMDDSSGIAILCINSPQRKNAFSGYMMAQFSDLLDQLERWDKGQFIIVHGADNFFCSGADLKTIRQNNLSDQCGAHFISRLMHSNLTRFERLPLVSVALIEGKALGGGAEIITACDFRVAVHDARIGFVHARLGVTPGFGGGTRLIRLVGSCKALQLMLSAKLIDAQTAYETGLVQHVLEPGIRGEEALEATKRWYRTEFGSISSFASRAIKSIAATGLCNIPTEKALEIEANIFCSVWGREEHMKALASNIKHNG